MKKRIILAIIVIMIVAAIYYLQSTTPKIERKELGTSVAEKAKQYPKALELVKPDGYINTDPNITIGSLIGKKVILVDFWTYTCINCIRTIPYLNAWYDKYKDQGLEIIGIHSPEFDFEKDYNNVKRAVEQFGIKYPVVLDNDHQTWNAYQNRYWPHKYLIDIDGYIVYDHIGEGGYDVTEKKIQDLLEERAKVLNIQMEMNKTIGANITLPEFEKIKSPEIYLGYDTTRGFFGNAEGFVPGQVIKYTIPNDMQENYVYLQGNWQNNPDNMQMVSSSGKIVLTYNSKTANIVASADKPVNIEVALDGAPHKKLTISESRLYVAAEATDYGVHKLEINILSPGFRIYTFTFG